MTETLNADRDRLIHILVVHFDMFRAKAEEAADLFLHDKALALRTRTDGVEPAEWQVEAAYEAAAKVLQGTSADIGIGELDRLVRAALRAAAHPAPERSKVGVPSELLFTTIQDAYLRGLDWGRKYQSTEEEELKASYDYADKTVAALEPSPIHTGEVAHERDNTFDLDRSIDSPTDRHEKANRALYNVIDWTGAYRGQIALTSDEHRAINPIRPISVSASPPPVTISPEGVTDAMVFAGAKVVAERSGYKAVFEEHEAMSQAVIRAALEARHADQ